MAVKSVVNILIHIYLVLWTFSWMFELYLPRCSFASDWGIIRSGIGTLGRCNWISCEEAQSPFEEITLTDNFIIKLCWTMGAGDEACQWESPCRSSRAPGVDTGFELEGRLLYLLKLNKFADLNAFNEFAFSLGGDRGSRLSMGRAFFRTMSPHPVLDSLGLTLLQALIGLSGSNKTLGMRFVFRVCGLFFLPGFWGQWWRQLSPAHPHRNVACVLQGADHQADESQSGRDNGSVGGGS